MPAPMPCSNGCIPCGRDKESSANYRFIPRDRAAFCFGRPWRALIPNGFAVCTFRSNANLVGSRNDPACHSMTSSAVARNQSGMVRPSAFAALRLTTKSYLVGNCTGSSLGFTPLRRRST